LTEVTPIWSLLGGALKHARQQVIQPFLLSAIQCPLSDLCRQLRTYQFS